MLAALVRSWMMLSLNNRRLSALITASVGAALVIRLINFPDHLLTVGLAIVTSALGFIAISAENFGVFLKRALILIKPGEELAAEIPATGLSALDEFVAAHRRYIHHLLETISAVGSEAEKLIERHELVTNNLAASVVIRDANGRVTYASPYSEVLTGYAVSEIYEQTTDFFLSIIHEEDLANYQRAQGVALCGEPFQFRFRFYHRTGIEMWAEARTVPILDSEGEVTTTLSIILDVTAAVRYQRQVEEQNRDLQDFTYMLSHDLKAPINTIRGMASVLQEDYSQKLDGDGKESVDHIIKATDRLSNLVSSVLQYSKVSQERAKHESVELKSVIDDVLADHASSIKESKAEISITQDLPAVNAERVKLYQIISNLIGNAIKYRVSDRPLKISIELDSKSNSRRARIAFSDNGSGIAADKIATIFRPFQRAHAGKVEGMGIGLACVKKLTEKLGGNIEVESTLGSGSRFILTVPTATVAIEPKGVKESLLTPG